ncbi:DUF3310 domain-containing protein [Siphonobacter curvatus]|uniref:DUF3310 domain-containing protein n=1 Tax=Siphonobacter curvatus TaxID=2094562 RepID=A0A2S7IR61_9BACT|nr:DUF3310 domain-containing protein [Siphonobacter curvatus]PQA60166.1 hypothetical protein C5O19_11265 [Siphonobacter curvatus]
MKNETPSHYVSNGMESEEAMSRIYGPEEVAIFYKLSRFKYLWRAGKKDEAIKDVGKALHCEAKAAEFYRMAEPDVMHEPA